MDLDASALFPEAGPSHVISTKKAIALRTLMAAIMFLTGTYVGVDWAAYVEGFANHYSPGAGYARTVLCALLAWLVGDNQINLRDARLLGVAFALALVADWFLTLQHRLLPGTIVYILVHAVLVVRHSAGFRDSLAPGRRARTIRFLVATALVAYGGSGLLIWKFAPILARNGQLPLDAAYLLLLATSMWMAWGTLVRDFYERRNAWLIAVGMTSFYFCDVSVGLAGALAGTKTGMVLDNLVGFFYSPALVMLAFSAYRWVAPGAPVSQR